MINYPMPNNSKYNVKINASGGGSASNVSQVIIGTGGTGGVHYGQNSMHISTGTWGYISPVKEEPPKWEPWFAWYPVKAGGKYKWLSTVYRKQGEEKIEIQKSFNSTTYITKRYWIYGTVFDKLKE